VEVHYDEGIAIYIGAEPCVGLREPGALSVGQMLTEQPGPRREGEEP